MTAIAARIRAAAPRLHPARLGRLAHGSRFRRADGLMVCTMLIWSINITSVKVVVHAIPPLGFGLLRYVTATTVLLAILWAREGSLGLRRADLGWAALGGIVGFGLNQTAFLLGIRLINASLAAILLATTPLLTAALAAIWAWEPLRRRTLLSLAISFAGIVAVILGAGARVSASWQGALLILASAATLAISAICAKRVLQHASSLRATTWMSLFGCLSLAPLGLPALLGTPGSAFTPHVIVAATFTVIGSTVLGNLAWNYAVQQLGAARTTTYTYLQPVMGAAIAMVLLGERLTLLQGLGGVVVLAGLLLYPRPRRAAPG